MSSFPLELGPLKSSQEVWGCAVGELRQRGLGRSPSRNRILCILALKCNIWWQKKKISHFAENQLTKFTARDVGDFSDVAGKREMAPKCGSLPRDLVDLMFVVVVGSQDVTTTTAADELITAAEVIRGASRARGDDCSWSERSPQ